MLILGLLFLVLFLLRFEAVAAPVAGMLGVETRQVLDFADHSAFIALGLLLVIVGWAFLAVPVLSWVVIAAGAALIIYSFWMMRKRTNLVSDL